MVWTPPPTWRSGRIVSAFELNLYLRDNLLELKAGQPSVLVRFTPNFALPNATWTIITAWDTVAHDVGGFWSGTNPDRLTIPSPGVYVAGGHTRFQNSYTAGSRNLAITLNDTATPPTNANFLMNDRLLAADDSLARLFARSHPVRMVAGDVVRMVQYQSQGSARNIVGTTTYASPSANGFWCYKVAD